MSKRFTFCTICGLRKPGRGNLSLVICRDREHEARERHRDEQLAKGGSYIHQCTSCKECDVYPQYEIFCPNCGAIVDEHKG